MANTDEAKSALDYMLFDNVYNMPELADWEVAFEGDNYVMHHWPTGKLFHFSVRITPFEWDSSKVRKEQEWPV